MLSGTSYNRRLIRAHPGSVRSAPLVWRRLISSPKTTIFCSPMIDLAAGIFDIESLSHGIARPKKFILRWQRAKVPYTGPDDGYGHRRRNRRAVYSGRTVIRFALIAEATGYGVPINHAWPPAVQFTEGIDFCGSPDHFRLPCEPFLDGKTWIVFSDKSEPGRLLNVTEDNWRDLLSRSAESSVIVIDCLKIKKGVLARLETRMRVGC